MYRLSQMRPAWAEININALIHNMKEIRRVTSPNASIMAVVKANAYSHGTAQIAPYLLENGADRLAVAFLDEALELREEGVTAPILILGYTEPQHAEKLIRYDFSQMVFSYELAKALSDEAGRQGKLARIHIKIDTGMGRIGFLPTEESLEDICRILALPHILFEGLCSHFATADEADKSYAHTQLARYNFMKDALAERGFVPTFYHIANSAAIIDMPEAHFDMVRPGIIMFGIYPSEDVHKEVIHLMPTLSLKAHIVYIKTLPADSSVSYGRKYTTNSVRRIATLPIGYEDGYTRLYSNKAHVLVHGKRAPIVGSICMDQCMIDVTDIPEASVGDEVVLIGQQGEDAITPEELASHMGTISYEVLCMIGRRIPRVYIDNGQIIDAASDLIDITK